MKSILLSTLVFLLFCSGAITGAYATHIYYVRSLEGLAYTSFNLKSYFCADQIGQRYRIRRPYLDFTVLVNAFGLGSDKKQNIKYTDSIIRERYSLKDRIELIDNIYRSLIEGQTTPLFGKFPIQRDITAGCSWALLIGKKPVECETVSNDLN